VLSFASLIAIGTVLLMLPRCRPAGEPAAPLLKALFTATSASCVTGLVLDPPGSYWSRSGQLVILGLIQFGGLGIMTFSAFFALALGRKLPVREQMTFRELLESERIGDVGGMIRAILLLTLGIECAGAVLMSTLWPDLPLPDRVFYGVFHAVSAFCNAGFSLRDASLIGWEAKWQVWGVVPALIILGGLGFNVIDNWQRYLRARWLHSRHPFAIVQGTRPRITLTTRLVTLTTACLLVLGTALVFLFELDNPRHPLPLASQFANAWFQSVTFRTAGFNTIDNEHLRPATKLLGIVFMFIGASPGSTGGGVKTICLALMLITLRSVMRGRPAVETGGRMIPEEQVFRGLAIITLGLATMMLTALFLVMIENEPARLVDQLYEAASAFGTVGLSANLTPTLKPASQFVLIIAMFLGRVGPLTLIVALSGNRRPRNYAFPEERIALG
jgi:trk system potassium uptake protein